MMKRAILIAALLLLTTSVFAGPNANLRATAPTQYVGGLIIPFTDILTYLVYCGNTSGGPYLFVFDAPNLTEAVGAVIDVTACVQGVPGIYYFVATATSTVSGFESNISNEASRAYVTADFNRTPNAPILLTIQ